MRISDWSSDVCSSDLATIAAHPKCVRQLVAKVAPAPHAHLKPQLALTAAQDRFHLGIALKAFRHARHFLARLLAARHVAGAIKPRSEEHTSELQSLMRISYAVFCLKKKKKTIIQSTTSHIYHKD